MRPRKGSATLWVIGIVVLLVLGGVLTVPDWLGSSVGDATGRISLGAGVSCPDDFETSLNARVRNPMNASAEFIPAPLHFGRNGNDEGSTTATAGGAYGAIKSTAVCGGDSYELWTQNDASYVACKVVAGVMSGPSVDIDIECAKSAELEFVINDATLTNLTGASLGDSSWDQDATTTSNLTMGSGDTKTVYLYLRANAETAQWGSDILPNYICADFPTAKFSKLNGVILSGAGVTSASIPEYASSDGMDKCWKITAVKITEGYRTLTAMLKADLGDPAQNVKFKGYDGHFFQDNSGKRGEGIANSALSAIGETDRHIEILIG